MQIAASSRLETRAISFVFKKTTGGDQNAPEAKACPRFICRNRIEEKRMKKYVKPSLTALGLLREVTKFSGCPAGYFPFEGHCQPDV
jgi:hypothetical protein